MLFSLITFLILLSALLSASETSLTASSKPRIRHLVKKGNKKASVVESLLGKLESVISAVLLGNTLLNILASTLMTGALINLFGEAGVVYSTFIMMFLILLFAEVMPKLYAVRYPEKSALFLSVVISNLIIILKPFTRFIEILSQNIWKILGVNLNAQADPDTYEEDLRGAIDLHRNSETENHEESHHMLKSILDLNNMTVRKILVHRKDMITIDFSQKTDHIIDTILKNPYTRYPIWEGNPENIIGILHARDLFKALPNFREKKVTHSDLKSLISKPWYVPESTAVFAQLQAFRKRKEHLAFVIDEYGSLQGIVTLEDILEEIVGEISDEHDPANQIAQKQKDGSLIVRGHTTIRDLNRNFNWELPLDRAITLAGLVIYTCRLIPKKGQEVNVYGFRIKVLERQRNQLTKLQVFPPIKQSN